MKEKIITLLLIISLLLAFSPISIYAQDSKEITTEQQNLQQDVDTNSLNEDSLEKEQIKTEEDTQLSQESTSNDSEASKNEEDSSIKNESPQSEEPIEDVSEYIDSIDDIENIMAFGGSTTSKKMQLQAAHGGGVANLKNGDKITFHHEADAGGVDLFTFSGYPNIVGFCCEPGVSTNESGTATVKVVSNNTLLAKTLYYIHIKGWDTNEHLYSTGPGPLPSGWWYRTVIQTMTQYAAVGNDAVNYWKTHYSPPEWSDANIQMVINEVNNKASKVTVPDNFRAFIATQSGQDSAVLYQPATGKLKISKTVQEGITEPTFTFNIYVAGVNGTYSGVTFSNGNASIALKHGQSKTIENLPGGKSYSVTEQSIIGWELVSSSGTTGTIPSGSTATASFTNKIKYIDITINKGTTNADVTNENSLYDVSGTTFALYKTQADARKGSNPAATFTISNNGSSETKAIQEGGYYLVETKAGTGYLIPDSLKDSSGGVYIDATSTQTINLP